MRVRLRRVTRCRRVLAFAVAVLIGAGVAVGPSSAARPLVGPTGAPGGTRRAATDDPPSSDPTRTLPDPPAFFGAATGLAASARVDRAQVSIDIPVTFAAAYEGPSYREPPDLLVPAPSYFLPAHPKPQCDYHQAVLDSDLYAVDIDQPDPDKPGTIVSVGQFGDARVSLLAFGSVPVTATLHTRQVVRDGRLVPITADTVSSNVSSYKDGSTPPDPCDGNWDNSVLPYTGPASVTTSHAELNASITDVTIDGQSVDVGSSCHTATPLELYLTGDSSYVLALGGRLVQQYDPSTTTVGPNVYPLHPTSRNLTIPVFADCVDPATGEDLSRLVTAMVSGPDNTLVVNQAPAIFSNISNSNPSLCAPDYGCVVPPKYLAPPQPGRHTR